MESTKTDKPTLNILLVEDNPGDVFLIKNFLTTAGIEFSLKHASRLDTALQLLNAQKFDVILLDLGLPDSVGLETLRKLNVPNVKSPVVVLTGLDDEDVAVASVKEGAQDYLVKNRLSTENIVRAIKYSIERKNIQEIQKRHTQQFALLSLATSSINACEDVQSIYRFICKNIKKLLDEIIVIVVEIADNNTARVVESAGLDPYSEQIRLFTGSDLYQTIFHINDHTQKVLNLLNDEKLHEIEGGIYGMCKGNYKQEICLELEKMMGINKTYAINFLRNGKIYGGSIIFSKKIIGNEDKNIIEAIGSQASLNIDRRYIENDLKLSEKRYRELNEELELKVAERTEELATTNDLLQDELEERKQIQEILRESEERYRSLVETSPDGVIVHREGKFLYANSVALQMYGAETLEQLQTKTVVELIHPDEQSTIEARIRLGQRGQKIPLQETKMMSLDGRVTEVETSGSRINFQGKPSIQIIIHDITERKKKEFKLLRLNQTLMAIDKCSQAMIRARDEAEYVENVCKIIVEDCNHSMVWIGYAQDDEDKTVKPVAHAGFEQGYLETLNLTWADAERGRGPTGSAIRTGKAHICHNMLTDPRFEPWREQAIKRGYASSVALPLRADGKTFGAITIYSKEPDPFSENEVELLSELANDLSYGITAIRWRMAQAKAEKALRKYASDLKDLNATKDKFFGIIAHDLRNPFTALLGASEILSNNASQYNIKNIQKFSQILNDAAKYGYALLENLLEWARSQTGNFTYAPEIINIKDVVAENLSNINVLAIGKKIKLQAEIPEDIQVKADKNMLNTIMRNLLNNAVKFTYEGGKVSVIAQTNNNDIILTVKDTGVGIPKKDIGKLFRMDIKYSNVGTAQERGTGLGLLLCKEFVEKHGGKIWVASSVGKGSEFKFSLPLKGH